MKEKLCKLTSNDPREIAIDAIYDVFENSAYTNLSLEKRLKHSNLTQVDRNLVTELANGTVRMVKHLDWVLNLFLKKPVEKQNPWMKNILRMSVYQLLFMDKIPDYAIVNTAVNLSRKMAGKTLSGVVNGVLRNIISTPGKIVYPTPVNGTEYYSVFYSQPAFLVNAAIEQWGQNRIEEILRYWNERAHVTLRSNLLKIDLFELQERLQEEGVMANSSSFFPYALEIEKISSSFDTLQTYQQGLFYIQNEASMLAAHILNPAPGDKVFDLCCGVGGKTTHFAEYMKNQGQIEAFDIHNHKIQLLQQNCHRLGINIVKGEACDLLMFDAARKAQKVFLDAPCSGWGVLNRRADSRWTQSEKDILELIELQSKLIHKAGELVERGGTLVYSTCTINRMENEQRAASFLAENPDFVLEGFEKELMVIGLDQEDRNHAAQGMLTLLPGKYQTDGMFYAKFKRN